MAEGGLDREEFSDFTLVLQDGRELPCHKIVLARESMFFRRMLKQDFKETCSNRMSVTEFEPDTTEDFLDFIYADIKHVPEQDIFKKDFDEKRLTPDLLRMSHLYEVKILLEMCVQHLKKNIVDDNVVDIWSAAEITGSESLRVAALVHLGNKLEKMMEISGMEETCKSPQMMKSLVMHMCAQSRILAKKIAEEKKNSQEITVKVQFANRCDIGYSNGRWGAIAHVLVKVKPSDTIATLRTRTNAAIASLHKSPSEGELARVEVKKDSFEHSEFPPQPLEWNTIEELHIKDGDIVTCAVEPCLLNPILNWRRFVPNS